MSEHLKFALSWWHTMGGDGTDMFGTGTADKSWGAADPMEIAKVLAERTNSVIVQVIGKKIVLYKPAKKEEDRKIILPKAKKKAE